MAADRPYRNTGFVDGSFDFGDYQKTNEFFIKKITAISFLAVFNKGISGGGYGPLVMAGQSDWLENNRHVITCCGIGGSRGYFYGSENPIRKP